MNHSQQTKEYFNGTISFGTGIIPQPATEHLDMEVVDYVPCYRSPAGTGCAMGFASWS